MELNYQGLLCKFAAFACILELLAEPLYILSQNLLLLKLRLIVETAATLLRCLTVYIFIIMQIDMVRNLYFQHPNTYIFVLLIRNIFFLFPYRKELLYLHCLQLHTEVAFSFSIGVTFCFSKDTNFLFFFLSGITSLDYKRKTNMID